MEKDETKEGIKTLSKKSYKVIFSSTEMHNTSDNYAESEMSTWLKGSKERKS